MVLWIECRIRIGDAVEVTSNNDVVIDWYLVEDFWKGGFEESGSGGAFDGRVDGAYPCVGVG